MIGWISGTVRHRAPGVVIVDTGGVGYELRVPASTEDAIGNVGGAAELFVHTHLKEDGITLYGFATLFDREIFLHLLNVAGIGPKTAVGILSAIPAERLVETIRSKNVDQLHSLPGVGKKTAERMVIELVDRLKYLPAGPKGQADPSRAPSGLAEEVISALMNLGYKQAAAEAALSRVDLSDFRTFDRILKETLRHLAK